MLIWAWFELAFLSGLITGPSKQLCPKDIKQMKRFGYALSNIAYSELILFITLINLLSFFCYGLVLEFLQGFTATRSPEVWDIFANALGLLVYFIFAPKLRYRS